MKIKIFILGLMLLCSFISNDLLAQAKGQNDGKKNIEAAKIGFYTKQMNLSANEAKIFWPLYDTYEKAIQEQKADRRQNLDEVNERLKDMSDSEINKLIDSRLLQTENALKARKLFISELRKELPPLKVAQFFKAEEQFKRALLQRVNENIRDKQMPAKRRL